MVVGQAGDRKDEGTDVGNKTFYVRFNATRAEEVEKKRLELGVSTNELFRRLWDLHGNGLTRG